MLSYGTLIAKLQCQWILSDMIFNFQASMVIKFQFIWLWKISSFSLSSYQLSNFFCYYLFSWFWIFNFFTYLVFQIFGFQVSIYLITKFFEYQVNYWPIEVVYFVWFQIWLICMKFMWTLHNHGLQYENPIHIVQKHNLQLQNHIGY